MTDIDALRKVAEEATRGKRGAAGARATYEKGRARRTATLAGLQLLGPTTCWPWPSLRTGGYARVYVGGKGLTAHRWTYELLRGPIPEGLVLDHLCRNRACVNPDHLEPVSNRVNTLRGIALTSINSRKTHCRKDHPFDAENTYWRADGSRACRACNRERMARRKRQLREARG